MTTCVYKDGVLASDSQATSGDMVFSEHFQKVYKLQGCLICFTGNVLNIQSIVSTLSELETLRGVEAIPLLSEDTKLLIIHPDQRVFEIFKDGYHEYPREKVLKGFALGSGTSFAEGALSAGCDAIGAVKAAISLDVFSGGKVQSLTFSSPDSEIDESYFEGLEEYIEENKTSWWRSVWEKFTK